jgi:hypothetical protein
MFNVLCSPPRGPDGHILYDPYEHTKEVRIELGLICVAILALQSGLALGLFRNCVYPGIGAMLVAVHPAWTLRWATDGRSGDCGFLQLFGSYVFVPLLGLLAATQCLHGFWRRGRGESE